MKDASRKSRRLKCCIVIVVTALLAVVTTVAVSWGCALWVDPLSNTDYFAAPVGGSDLDFEGDADFNMWFVQEFAVAGGAIVRSSWWDEDVRILTTGGWPEDPPEAVLPKWCGDTLRPELLGTSGQSHTRYGDAWGWPFVSMWTRWSGVSPPLVAPTSLECHHGIRLERRGISRTVLYANHERALPLALIWPGFVLNVLVYWCAWMMLYMGLMCIAGARVRWRRAKGKCTTCGYDLRGSEVACCPECGHQKSAQA